MPKFKSSLINSVKYIEMNGPFAYAYVKGTYKYPEVFTSVEFYELKDGIFIIWEAAGLPSENDFSIHGFHIHDENRHYDTDNNPHPYHNGDLPPLFANNGYAFGSVFTSRITPKEVIGKTLTIHLNPNDFTTKASGDSGEKIATGIIEPL